MRSKQRVRSKNLSFTRTVSHPHSSWLDLPPFPLPQRLTSLHLPSHNHKIHAQLDGLVDWPYKVRSHIEVPLVVHGNLLPHSVDSEGNVTAILCLVVRGASKRLACSCPLPFRWPRLSCRPCARSMPVLAPLVAPLVAHDHLWSGTGTSPARS